MATTYETSNAASKAERLRALADESRHLAVVAIDHRGALSTPLARAAGREVGAQDLIAFKSAVVRILSPDCSAMLLDPEYGMTAAAGRTAGCGLLLAYEKSGYDNTRPGRRPDLIATCSAAGLRRAGAQAVKILLHYSELEAAAVNEEKTAFIERVGAECWAEGMPFLLEIITYDASGAMAPAEFAQQRPGLIGAAVAEFAQPRYRVDVLKLELPVAANLVPWGREESLRRTHDALAGARQPIVFLSGGVGIGEFIAGLELAAAAGVAFHGALCGRAVWNGGIAAYGEAGGGPGAEARLVRWLEQEGRANLAQVRACLARHAAPLPA